VSTAVVLSSVVVSSPVVVSVVASVVDSVVEAVVVCDVLTVSIVVDTVLSLDDGSLESSCVSLPVSPSSPQATIAVTANHPGIDNPMPRMRRL